jgi:hypothetical protein
VIDNRNIKKCLYSQKALIEGDGLIKIWKREWDNLYNNSIVYISDLDNKLGSNYNETNEPIIGINNIKHKCTIDCTEYIITIDSKLNIYACALSGEVHKCNGNNCKKTILTNKGMYVCIYSGKEVEKYLTRHIYGKWSDKMDNTHNDSFENEDEPIIEDYNIDIYNFANNDNNVKIINNSLNEKKSTDVKKRKRKHKTNKKNRISNHIHLLDSNLEKYDEKKLIDNCKKLLNDILWNKTERLTHIRNSIIQQKNKFLNKIGRYLNHCYNQNLIINTIDISTIFSNIFIPEYINIIDYDDNMANIYSNICTKLWLFIINSKYYKENTNKFNWYKHIIGSLFLLKSGYSIIQNDNITRIELVKPDPYLQKYLIPENSMKLLNNNHIIYKKGDITCGINNIKSTISNLLLLSNYNESITSLISIFTYK